MNVRWVAQLRWEDTVSEEDWEDFGEELRSRRLAEGWDQSELARRIGSTATTVGRWENGAVPRRPHYIIALKRELGFTHRDFLKAFAAQASSSKWKNDQYRACSFATAAEKQGSFRAVFETCNEIMDEWPVPEKPGEYGDNEKWLELLQLSPESGGVMFRHDEIVGYWSCLAVHDDIYQAILRGENVNKRISADDIWILLPRERYKLYFVDLFLRKLHKNIVTRRLLLEDFLAFMREAAEQGIFFDRIVTNVTGIEVKQLCQGLGFRKVIDHQVHQMYDRQKAKLPAEIYELAIGPDAKRLFSHDPKLIELYAAEGLFDPEA
jgi:transcriptional regulator with XRE-family HTH domain